MGHGGLRGLSVVRVVVARSGKAKCQLNGSGPAGAPRMANLCRGKLDFNSAFAQHPPPGGILVSISSGEPNRESWAPPLNAPKHFVGNSLANSFNKLGFDFAEIRA